MRRAHLASFILDSAPVVIAVLMLIAIAITFPGCASTPSVPSVLDQFAGTMEGVCDVWSTIRDKYPDLRESAILVRELGGIDDETWASFVWIDEHAAQLDRWLALICDAREGAANAHLIAQEKAGVDWNSVGANVLKVAAFALKSGII